jgi:sterol desaturase/sphingolipid hydroxylase (fatty acid hydroxylase superfamily)
MERLILLAAVLALLVLERFSWFRFELLPLRRRFAGSDLIYLLTSGVGLSLLAQNLAIRFLAPASTFGDTAALVIASFVLFDLGSYVSHRLLHRFEFLWEVHKVHHSSRHLDWLATFRGHLLEHALRQVFSPVLLIALGIPLSIVAACAAVHGAWSVFVHSNFGARLRFLDPILITPRLHRLHHVATSCEKNFGVGFSIWDRLAGTLTTAVDIVSPLGVPGELDAYPQTWTAQLIEPFRRWRLSARSAAAAGGAISD